jgi:heme/copper-type cytochrome/quinol oxidase subunit 3
MNIGTKRTTGEEKSLPPRKIVRLSDNFARRRLAYRQAGVGEDYSLGELSVYWLPTIFLVASVIFNILAVGSAKDKETKRALNLAFVSIVFLVVYFITIPLAACKELSERLEKLEKSAVLKAESENK